MKIIAIKTRALRPPRDDLFSVLDESVPKVLERDIFLVTSKVLSIHQGRCVPIGEIDKDELVRREAEKFISTRTFSEGRHYRLTQKGHTLLGSAGVDESNGNGYYVLFPDDPSGAAREMWHYLREKHGVRDLGIIVTDSHSVPLRGGAVGVSIGFRGFEPLLYHKGRRDIFGREIKGERSNVPDALAAAGVFAMGEVNEQTPLALVRGADSVVFTDEDRQSEFFLDEKDDFYAPLLQALEHGN